MTQNSFWMQNSWENLTYLAVAARSLFWCNRIRISRCYLYSRSKSASFSEGSSLRRQSGHQPWRRNGQRHSRQRQAQESQRVYYWSYKPYYGNRYVIYKIHNSLKGANLEKLGQRLRIFRFLVMQVIIIFTCIEQHLNKSVHKRTDVLLRSHR